MNKPWIRILIILAGTLVLLVIGKFTAIGAWFSFENISSIVIEAGPWGFLIFATVFAIGSLLQIPAMIFVLAAILIYGPINGTVLGYLGVIVAMEVNYLVVKKVGGQALSQIKNRHVRLILSKLHTSPLKTIVLLRLILWASPVLNTTLAMTSVTSTHYFMGSSIGMVIPTLVFATAVHLFKELVIPMII